MKYPVLFLAVLFLSCSSSKKESLRIVDLPDSVFAYRNLSSTLVKNKFSETDTSIILYRDSTRKFKLHMLDTNQRKRIIAPIIAMDSFYVAHSMPCYLVAKQDKIGELTPIIFEVDGDDYSALIYVLLDKNDKPISNFILEGGQYGGPTIHGTPPILPTKVSFINDNSISSYILHYHWKNGDSLATVDSVCYKTVISKTGLMNTIRTDSNRYTCAPKDW